MGEQYIIDIKYIKDIHGNRRLKDSCHKFKDGWYLKNIDCLEINSRYFKIKNNINIVFDNEKCVYVNKNTTKLVYGIIDVKNNILIYGYFTCNLHKNVSVKSVNGTITAINSDILKDSYTEKLDSGIYYPNNVAKLSPEVFSKKSVGKRYSIALDYKCNPMLPKVTKIFNEYFEPYNILALEGTEHENIYNLLSNTTFGLEYETFDGRLPENICFTNGLIPLKDGSLRRRDPFENEYISYEYTTIVLSGKTGLEAIKNQCLLLNKYCEHSNNESLHLHLGNTPVSKEYVVSLYNNIQLLQDEIYSMFPEAMRKTSIFKNKDYCKPLPKIKFVKDFESNFDKIYKYLLDGHEQPFTVFGKFHPADYNNHSKWNLNKRYAIVNLITLVFNPQQTVEFRVHPSTFDKDSISYWLYLTNAITQFSYKHKDDKLFNKLTLTKVLQDIYNEYPELIKWIRLYVFACKKDMKYKKKMFGDIIGTIMTVSWKDQLKSNFKELI